MKFLLFFLASFLYAQTRPVPVQIHWSQTDDSFYRQCIFNADGSFGGYTYIPNLFHGTVSSTQFPSTYLRMSQVSGYGVSVSSDGTQLIIQNWGGSWIVTSANTTATGTIEYRIGTFTPNLNLIGILSTDVTMMPYGWTMTVNAGYSVPPLTSVSLLKGIFTLVPSTTVWRNTCELLGGGPYPDITPSFNKPSPGR